MRDTLLGSAFEALIGALYLQSGLHAVEAFVSPMLEDARESVLDAIHDPKSQFQEWAQSQKFGTPRYRTVSSSGPDHAKQFTGRTGRPMRTALPQQSRRRTRRHWTL
jgi:ribonuclease-3